MQSEAPIVAILLFAMSMLRPALRFGDDVVPRYVAVPSDVRFQELIGIVGSDAGPIHSVQEMIRSLVMPPSRFSSDSVVVRKPDGSENGPYVCSVHGGRITIFDRHIDASPGDSLRRTLPNGRFESYRVRDAQFQEGSDSVPGSWILLVDRERTVDAGPVDTVELIAAGNLPTDDAQRVGAALQTLLDLIESSPATPEEKSEARSLFLSLLNHQAVRAAMGRGESD
jgi:hypothetical protein